MMSIDEAGIKMIDQLRITAVGVLAVFLLLPFVSAQEKSAAKSRSFLFTYGGTIKELKPGQTVNVWLPVAVDGPEQAVKIESKNLPGDPTIQAEKQYGNTSLSFQAKANDKGEVPFEVIYNVMRKEVKTDLAAGAILKPASNENLTRFLQPDAKVPISGKGWGNGDSVWACDSKFGNCSDFHSLFISMARGNKIPAKFEMGFPIPTKRGEGVVGGYHCWAWFLPNDKGWVPVDISEANRNPELKEYYFGNLTEDRVRFTTGRDINLEPRQKGPALNFFIYPYAEVDGQPYPQEKIERRFAYKDL
jgi:transglutaminase superfamily protein